MNKVHFSTYLLHFKRFKQMSNTIGFCSSNIIHLLEMVSIENCGYLIKTAYIII